MLTPEYLFRITENSEQIASELHAVIMQKIISRMMARLGRGEDYLLTATDKWQIEVLQEAGYLIEDILQEIARITKKEVSEIQEAMEEAGVESIEYDNKVYEEAGISSKPLEESPSLIRTLQRDYEATAGEWRNFARTTANEAQKTFIREMDRAYRMVISGGVSYSEAVRDVINGVSDAGITVKYPSGREMTIESATMMIVRTGISQASSDIGIVRAAENGAAYVLVSSHLGARPSHQKWQGKIYSIDWRELKRLKPGLIDDISDLPAPSNKYPDFVKATGYGSVDGLCGANCRHSFSIHYPGISNNPFEKYNSRENRELYEKQQRQRTLERRIRDSKRKVQNLQTAVDNCKDEKLKFELQQKLDRKSYTLSKQNKAYKQYCKENNLKEYAERLKVARWDRQQAAKAAGAARRYQNAKGE